jgi:hypothetical protein
MRLKWKLVLVRLKIVSILTQDRCTACTEHTIGSEIILHTPDETPRWCGSRGNSFRSIFRQCWSWRKIGARFAPNKPKAWKLFYTHPMKLLGDVGHVESHFSPFGDSISVGERCTICAERTTGSEIILDAHGGTTRWHVSCRILFHSICVGHTIGLEIILDAPDGPPRWQGSSGNSFRSVWR